MVEACFPLNCRSPRGLAFNGGGARGPRRLPAKRIPSPGSFFTGPALVLRGVQDSFVTFGSDRLGRSAAVPGCKGLGRRFCGLAPGGATRSCARVREYTETFRRGEKLAATAFNRQEM